MVNKSIGSIHFRHATIGMLCCAAVAVSAEIEVIYTEIPGHATAVVPGARDAAGNPVFAEFIALEDLNLSHDGTQWVLKGRNGLGTALDTLLLLGSGLTGDMFAQDGQPVQGGLPGELYDFFDSPYPASWDTKGNIGYSFRAKGGNSAIFEKVAVYDGVNHTIVLKMGDPALGLIDNPPGSSGDELFGNSINSAHLLDSGLVGFVNTPIQNCHSSRYPAFFRGNTSFRQSGVSTIGFETWDSFDLDGCGGTPDGAHWFAKGDTENPNTTFDLILAVDDVKVVQENTVIAGTSITAADIFFTRMLSNGDWFARGDDTADNDWALRNGVLIAKTGDPITSPLAGPSENWSAVFTAWNGNQDGDWVLAGNTNNANANIDNVLVLNSSEVIAREGDPVDLDGDGQFDDNAFISTFQPNDLFLTDDGVLYLLITLRNAALTPLGDAFIRIDPNPKVCEGDINPNPGDGVVNVDDLLEVINNWDGPGPEGDADGNRIVDVADLLLVINGWGPCP